MTGFFRRTGTDCYEASPAGHGPWSEQQLHGGPAAALLTRHLEAEAPDGGHLARVALDFLRPVPVGQLAVTTTLVKPGRAAVLLEATLLSAGEPLLVARAWWRRRDPGLVPAVAMPAHPFPPPETLPDAEPESDLAQHLHRGYVASMQWRYAGGRLEEPGPSQVWARPRIPLVCDEAPASPTQQALLLADCASGVSAALDFRTHLFSNLDLVVTLLRPPVPGWLSLDAVTAVDPAGGGLCSTTLGDESGCLGTVSQTLFVRPHA